MTSISVTASPADLARLRKRIASLVGAHERALKYVAAEVRAQVGLEFRESRDPYGKPWAPLKRRKGMPLRDTGRLMNSFAVETLGDAVRIGSNVSYAPIHQYGGRVGEHNRIVGFRKTKSGQIRFATSKKAQFMMRLKHAGAVIPARPMLPNRAQGLGAIWGPKVRDAIRRALKP